MDVINKLNNLFENKYESFGFLDFSYCDGTNRKNWYGYLRKVPGIVALGWPVKKNLKISSRYIKIEDPHNQATFILINKEFADKILVLGLP